MDKYRYHTACLKQYKDVTTRIVVYALFILWKWSPAQTFVNFSLHIYSICLKIQGEIISRLQNSFEQDLIPKHSA